MVFRNIIPIVQLESGDRNLFSLCEIWEEILSNGGGKVARAVHERRPFSREVVAQAQEQREVGLGRSLEQIA